MQNHSKKILNIAAFFAILSFLFSVLSFFNLGDIGNGNSVSTPLRIINRNVGALAIAIFCIVIYLWKHDSKK